MKIRHLSKKWMNEYNNINVPLRRKHVFTVFTYCVFWPDEDDWKSFWYLRERNNFIDIISFLGNTWF